MIFSLIIGFVLGAAALLFALQNTQIVALTFLGWQFSTSLALLVIGSVAIGAVISLLATIPSSIAASFRIGGLKRENRKLIQEAEDRLHEQTLRTQTIITDSEQIPLVVNLRN